MQLEIQCIVLPYAIQLQLKALSTDVLLFNGEGDGRVGKPRRLIDEFKTGGEERVVCHVLPGKEVLPLNVCARRLFCLYKNLGERCVISQLITDWQKLREWSDRLSQCFVRSAISSHPYDQFRLSAET